jgi:hypothetical protein
MAIDEASSVLLNGREVQIAKVPAERKQIFEGEQLLAKQEHLVLVPRGADGTDIVGSERPQIGAPNLCTDRSASRYDVERRLLRGSRPALRLR